MGGKVYKVENKIAQTLVKDAEVAYKEGNIAEGNRLMNQVANQSTTVEATTVKDSTLTGRTPLNPVSQSSSGVAKPNLGDAGKGNVATNNINQSLKLGETRVVNGVSVTRVGRWMLHDELAQMQSTGKVVQGAGGQTFISINGANDFKGAAPKGSVYVEFDVPSNSLLQGGNEGWYKMLGSNANGSQKWWFINTECK